MTGIAFGKVILFGEHSVVHRRLAIAAALDRGARAEATRGGDGPSLLRLGARLVSVEGTDDHARAYRAILERVGAMSGLVIEATPEVPPGAGLGCSAALAVAVTRAAAEATGVSLGSAAIRAAADGWERVFHGNPSGVDVAVATEGGVLAYRRGQAFDFLTLSRPIDLVVMSTGQAASTRAMVAQLGDMLRDDPPRIERTLDEMDAIARSARPALEAGRWTEVGPLMNDNHARLVELRLSTPSLDRACEVARGAGALGAKLTGGGGGGCAIALCPDHGDEVLEAVRRAGFEAFRARLGAAVR